MALRFSSRSYALVLVASIAAALTGCGMSSTSLGKSSGSTALATGQFGGRVHGGNQPITGAVVTLWAAGAPLTGGGGYGAGATLVSTTVSDPNGGFSFNVAGVSPCVTGQYLYVTATGGNTGAGINPYSALMAALPTPCSAATSGTFIWINEVTTVAAVWSLQQFMSISPSSIVPWQIGAPATNIVGMANAFAGSAQLVSLNSGTSAISTVTNTLSSGTYTTTITPDISRINTLADILAACVNTAGTSVCTSLFADTTPGTSTAPTDTIQAAYYLAANPAGLTMPSHSAANSPTYLCNQYVTAAGAPFIPALTCGTNTNDWLVGVAWKGVNGTLATTGTLYANSVAIDGNGNIWTGGGSGVTTNLINEFNPTGQFILNPVSTVTIPSYNVNFVNNESGTVATTSEAFGGVTGYALGYARPFSMAIDTLGNAWFNAYGGATPGTLTNGTITMNTGVIAEVTPSGSINGYLVGTANGALAIDGSNNIYFSNQQNYSNNRYYVSEITSASNYQTYYTGQGRGSGAFNNIFVDGTSSQFAWGLVTPGTCAVPSSTIRVNSASESSMATLITTVTDASACVEYGAPDALGNAWVTGNTGTLNYLNIASSLAATVTSIPAGTGGLNAPVGVAIDGLGNVWAMNRLGNSAVGGISEFSTTTNNGTTTYTALSPAGTGIYGFQPYGATGVSGISIDGSGNLWLVGANGSSLYHMIGAAAPVVTPTALAVKNGTIAVRP